MRKLIIVVLLFSFFSSLARATAWTRIAIGGGYQTVVLVSNKTAFDWTGNFAVFQGHEKQWAGSWNVNGRSFTGQPGFSVLLHGHGMTKLVISGDI